MGKPLDSKPLDNRTSTMDILLDTLTLASTNLVSANLINMLSDDTNARVSTLK